MLEAAGFSRCNPYNIVPQGKVNLLATAKDSDRLQLIKQIGGTDLYDARREEVRAPPRRRATAPPPSRASRLRSLARVAASPHARAWPASDLHPPPLLHLLDVCGARRQSVKIMEEAHERQLKIQEMLEYVAKRMGELHAEKEELERYTALDKRRKVSEYAYYDKELKKAKCAPRHARRTRHARGARRPVPPSLLPPLPVPPTPTPHHPPPPPRAVRGAVVSRAAWTRQTAPRRTHAHVCAPAVSRSAGRRSRSWTRSARRTRARRARARSRRRSSSAR